MTTPTIPNPDDPFIERYVRGEMSEQEATHFEVRMIEEPELAREVEQRQRMGSCVTDLSLRNCGQGKYEACLVIDDRYCLIRRIDGRYEIPSSRYECHEEPRDQDEAHRHLDPEAVAIRVGAEQEIQDGLHDDGCWDEPPDPEADAREEREEQALTVEVRCRETEGRWLARWAVRAGLPPSAVDVRGHYAQLRIEGESIGVRLFKDHRQHPEGGYIKADPYATGRNGDRAGACEIDVWFDEEFVLHVDAKGHLGFEDEPAEQLAEDFYQTLVETLQARYDGKDARSFLLSGDRPDSQDNQESAGAMTPAP